MKAPEFEENLTQRPTVHHVRVPLMSLHWESSIFSDWFMRLNHFIPFQVSWGLNWKLGSLAGDLYTLDRSPITDDPGFFTPRKLWFFGLMRQWAAVVGPMMLYPDPPVLLFQMHALYTLIVMCESSLYEPTENVFKNLKYEKEAKNTRDQYLYTHRWGQRVFKYSEIRGLTFSVRHSASNTDKLLWGDDNNDTGDTSMPEHLMLANDNLSKVDRHRS